MFTSCFICLAFGITVANCQGKSIAFLFCISFLEYRAFFLIFINEMAMRKFAKSNTSNMTLIKITAVWTTL